MAPLACKTPCARFVRGPSTAAFPPAGNLCPESQRKTDVVAGRPDFRPWLGGDGQAVGASVRGNALPAQAQPLKSCRTGLPFIHVGSLAFLTCWGDARRTVPGMRTGLRGARAGNSFRFAERRIRDGPHGGIRSPAAREVGSERPATFRSVGFEGADKIRSSCPPEIHSILVFPASSGKTRLI